MAAERRGELMDFFSFGPSEPKLSNGDDHMQSTFEFTIYGKLSQEHQVYTTNFPSISQHNQIIIVFFSSQFPAPIEADVSLTSYTSMLSLSL